MGGTRIRGSTPKYNNIFKNIMIYFRRHLSIRYARQSAFIAHTHDGQPERCGFKVLSEKTSREVKRKLAIVSVSSSLAGDTFRRQIKSKIFFFTRLSLIWKYWWFFCQIKRWLNQFRLINIPTVTLLFQCPDRGSNVEDYSSHNEGLLTFASFITSKW